MRLFLFSLLAVSTLFTTSAKAVTPDEMLDHILEVGTEVTQNKNIVEFKYKSVELVLVYDLGADRMRLVSPITRTDNVGEDLLLMALEANYHSVLDARYAVSEGVVWSAFIHPLSDLSSDLFASAISQVAIAHATFGDQFISGALVFPSS